MKNIPPERRKIRPNVEATMKEIKCRTKAGKLKIRGLFKTKLFAFNVGIAINFGRVYRYLTRADGINAPNSEDIITNLLSEVNVFVSATHKLIEVLIFSIFAYAFMVDVKHGNLQQIKYCCFLEWTHSIFF